MVHENKPYIFPPDTTWETHGTPSQFHPITITGLKHVSISSAVDTSLIGKYDYDLSNLIPLLRYLKIWYDTLIGIKIYYDDITLSLID